MATADTAVERASAEDSRQFHNVVALGWVAFFGGFAEDMIQPILPPFYASVLGLKKEFIGLIEGSLTTVVSLTKIGAGYASDALGRRKALVFAGTACQPSAASCCGARVLPCSRCASATVLARDSRTRPATRSWPDRLVAAKRGYAFGV
jgi:MFS family permease